jgi:hypothetical protein
MTKRRVWVEPLFAEAKQWHHLNKFRLRGRKNVNMKGLLIAAGQNLKRLLQATGWATADAGRSCGGPLSLGLNTQFAQQRARCAMGRRIAPRPHLTVAYPEERLYQQVVLLGPCLRMLFKGPLK